MCSDVWMRDEILKFLDERKKSNPNFSVLDVGGAAKPWADKYTDAYIDIKPFPTKKLVYLGDICKPEVWDKVKERCWDFTICTHVLEDIRNPEFVISQLLAVSKSGFIASPNKHQELSCIESGFWLGYGHHRWIFTIRDKRKLCIIAKWPVVNYFLPSNKLCHIIGHIFRFNHLINRILKLGSGLDWVDTQKAKTHRCELGFLWVNDFDYEFINQDYAGNNIAECIGLYYEDLKEGI